MTRKCKVEDCDNDTSKGAHGFCGKHYLRWTRYGRLNTIVNRGSGYTIDSQAYVVLFINGKRQYEHIVVAERALGKPLPKGAVVHHVDGQQWNNEPSNLVICPDQAYHMLLHRRMKELG